MLLETLRCDGRAHDGCARACKVFWKEAWLRPADEQPSALGAPTVESDGAARTTQDPGRRAPLLLSVDATPRRHDGSHRKHEALAPTHARAGGQNGDRRAPEAVRFIGRWARWTLLRAIHGDEWLRGGNTRTPTVTLGLQPGDRVRIKSSQEIVASRTEPGQPRVAVGSRR